MAKIANYIFTSESVCSGHPDKICDQISDAIVDAVLTDNPSGRAAIETLVTTNKIIIAGEVKTNKEINFAQVARQQIKRLGYTDSGNNFSDKSDIEVYVHNQSSEIAAGVDNQGAGDQGMMFGYACTDNSQLMPMPITIAHALAKQIDYCRENKILPYLRPDGKTQVTVEYKNGRPYKVTEIVLAVPHQEKILLKQVKNDLYRHVVVEILEKFGFSFPENKLIVNGTGVWHRGGPDADTGVTGRKIVVDGYGGYARVGGGAFSGKDPTKVDRSGAYASRFLAKNIVANKLADKAEVRLGYFIGAKRPLMQEVETFGTARAADKAIRGFMNKILDTSVIEILNTLDLRRPIYLPTASYGHFGNKNYPWEKIINF